MAAEPLITEHFFCDVGTYGAPARGRRLPESEKLRRQIEALTAKKWDNPDDRNMIDEQIEAMRQRLRHLAEHPDEDVPR